jgi:hypothetical protein
MDIRARDVKKYALKVTTVLFSRSELAEGFINYANRIAERKELDERRVEIIQQAVMLKYQLEKSELVLLWPEICLSINAKCRNLKNKLIAASSKLV